MRKEIIPGDRVKFESEEGPQHGRVAEIKPDIGNGERIALVHVSGTMNGKPWQIPVNDLQQDRAA